MGRTSLGLVMAAFIGAALACGDRTIEPEPKDFTEVERICADYWETNLACHEPPWFESYEECEHVCLHLAYIYNDTPCGEVMRAVYECVGSQSTCDLYNDSNNVHAEQYACKTEKDQRAEILPGCGQSDEDPYPHGEPRGRVRSLSSPALACAAASKSSPSPVTQGISKRRRRCSPRPSTRSCTGPTCRTSCSVRTSPRTAARSRQ